MKIAAGLVSERFPKVSSIIIRMTHHHKSLDQVLMDRTINFLPSSYAFFNLKCLTKGCDNGGLELTPVIGKMIKQHKKALKGKLQCKGKNNALAADHARITYEIGIKYSRKSK